jgi:hypothetical protein
VFYEFGNDHICTYLSNAAEKFFFTPSAKPQRLLHKIKHALVKNVVYMPTYIEENVYCYFLNIYLSHLFLQALNVLSVLPKCIFTLKVIFVSLRVARRRATRLELVLTDMEKHENYCSCKGLYLHEQ